ncbi:MAG: SPOR domain-containing protein, partial [Rhodospirillales bacterium]
MKRGVLLVFSAFMLGACALPMPVQIASWALDGISLLATQKSVADHGISFISRKDCAMWRVIKGEELCISDDAGIIAVAMADGETAELTSFETASGPQDEENANDSIGLADPVQVASIPSRQSPASSSSLPDEVPDSSFAPSEPEVMEAKPVLPEDLYPDPSEFADAWAFMLAASSKPEPETLLAAPTKAEEEIQTKPQPPVPVPASANIVLASYTDAFPPATASDPPLVRMKSFKVSAWLPMKPAHEPSLIDFNEALLAIKGKPPKAVERLETQAKTSDPPAMKRARGIQSGLYLVIGSFSKRDSALRQAIKHTGLEPKVVVSKMDGGELSLVVVGPFKSEMRRNLRSKVRRAGIFDAWA